VRFRLLLSESVRSLTANLSTSLAATMTVLIGMFLLGLFIALGTWVVSWSDHVKRELVVHVYFCTPLTCAGHDRTDREVSAVRDKLMTIPQVKSIHFVSKEAALQKMRKQRSDLFNAPLAGNPLPDSYEVIPKKGEQVEQIATALGTPKGVQKVNYGKKTAHQILRVAKVVESFFLVAVLVLLAASTLLIANTIRLSIFSRRREIEVMKLVGATNWFVRGPFMLEGLICGLLGSLGAVILLLLGRELVLPSILGHINTTSDVRALGFAFTALILLAAGLLLGAAGSGITLRRFLRV
jgi:cell division transport system permease protein